MIPKPPNKINLDEKLNRVFSKYIRFRDALKTTGTLEACVCVTCGKQKSIAQIDAGHCFRRGRDGTKYEETNVHGQCRGCNGEQHTFGRQYTHKMYIKMTHGEEELNRLQYLSGKLVIQRRDDWYLEKIEYYSQKLKAMGVKI
jgi:hypothetical protein